MKTAIIASALAATAAAATCKTGACVASFMNDAARDLLQLSKDYNAVCNTCSYSSNQLSALLNDNQNIEYDINNATASCNASSSFSNADLNSIASANVGMKTTVAAALSTAMAHQPGMKSQGLQGIVSSILVEQREDARELMNAIIAKATGTYGPSASSASLTIMSLFNQAIATYAA